MSSADQQRSSRLHSRRAEDSAWRSQQAQVDADIEGLARDLEAERLMAEMDASGVAIEDQIERLKAYFIARRDRQKCIAV